VTRPLRIAFCGASGTGKSSLARFLSTSLGLEMNPIGSRSVAAEMGFASPYDADHDPADRAAFQKQLLDRKACWEAIRESFVTDRTTLDNVAYTALHNVDCLTAEDLDVAKTAAQNYTHVFFCPMSAFFNLGDDPMRHIGGAYHKTFEAVLIGLASTMAIPYRTVVGDSREERQRFVLACLKERDL
jgi:hypothetical protein